MGGPRPWIIRQTCAIVEFWPLTKRTGVIEMVSGVKDKMKSTYWLETELAMLRFGKGKWGRLWKAVVEVTALVACNCTWAYTKHDLKTFQIERYTSCWHHVEVFAVSDTTEASLYALSCQGSCVKTWRLLFNGLYLICKMFYFLLFGFISCFNNEQWCWGPRRS